MRLGEAAERVGGWVNPENYEKPVLGVASLEDAEEGHIAFYGNPKYLKALRRTKASAVLVPHGFAEELPAARVWVENPAAAFAKLLEVFAPPSFGFEPGIHSTAVVAPDASIGEGASIQAFAVIESGARIGALYGRGSPQLYRPPGKSRRRLPYPPACHRSGTLQDRQPGDLAPGCGHRVRWLWVRVS